MLSITIPKLQKLLCNKNLAKQTSPSLTLTKCTASQRKAILTNVNKHEDEIIKLASERNNLDLSELTVFKCSS